MHDNPQIIHLNHPQETLFIQNFNFNLVLLR